MTTVGVTPAVRGLGKISSALRDGRLYLALQAQVMASTREVVCAEALVRDRRRGSGGSATPILNLAVSECSMGALGRWVATNACSTAVSLRAAGWYGARLAINVSDFDLSDRHYPSWMQELLSSFGLSWGALEFEVTEEVLARVGSASAHSICELNERGALVVIDDFGAKYSALGRLSQFGFGKLKLDRSITQGVPTSRVATAVARSTVELARELGITVVAEGVEEQRQHEALIALGCDFVQGYYVGRPVQYAAFVRRWRGNFCCNESTRDHDSMPDMGCSPHERHAFPIDNGIRY